MTQSRNTHATILFGMVSNRTFGAVQHGSRWPRVAPESLKCVAAVDCGPEFFFDSISVNLSLNSHMWLEAMVLDGAPLDRGFHRCKKIFLNKNLKAYYLKAVE